MRSPGPPAEKEPPPPSRNWSTVTVMAPFTSAQPPLCSNARAVWVRSSVENCLQPKSQQNPEVAILGFIVGLMVRV